ncbi:hypothetical protein MPTK1_2g23030 [Marchantia polymorpha subsp. ruderalis]|uniref:Uncharacterized protein n=1 Tax=Marchantia polymorpha TaxID=3197 RepID=A0A2R6WN47_MARPO|nr:hypothetical protein MARPO_0072s0028 [Marchantia polymorpha]BBN03380.1 hypothetical protein Mp_2g23030 [Marchantia polymorpha subsp. ruderalis]|eukprot:PTQ35271.1 hypothetical protein MARPO_0072s0028 [Marchantia polymorpha]
MSESKRSSEADRGGVARKVDAVGDNAVRPGVPATTRLRSPPVSWKVSLLAPRPPRGPVGRSLLTRGRSGRASMRARESERDAQEEGQNVTEERIQEFRRRTEFQARVRTREGDGSRKEEEK